MFANIEWYVYVPLIIGTLMILAELFTRSFGIVGVLGILIDIGASIAQGFTSKPEEGFQTVEVLILLACVAVLVLIVRSIKYGFLAKMAFVETKTAIPVDYSDKKRNVMRSLLGKTGVAITPFRPVGKFMLDKVTYEGITNGEMIDEGEIIKIVDVEGVKIRVEKKKK